MGCCISQPRYRPSNCHVSEKLVTKCRSFSSDPIWTLAGCSYVPSAVLVGDDDGNIFTFSYADKKVHSKINIGVPITRCKIPTKFKPTVENPWFFAAGRDNSVSLFNLSSNNQIITKTHTFDPHNAAIYGLCCSQDGTWMCSGSRDYSLRKYDTETRKLIASVAPRRNVVTDMCLFDGSSNSPMILQTSEDLAINLWSDSLQLVSKFHVTNHFATSSCAVTSSLFATLHNGFSGAGGNLNIWDVRNPTFPVSSFSEHNERGNCVVTYDEDRLASVGADGSLILYSISQNGGGVVAKVQLPGQGISLSTVHSTTNERSKIVAVGCDSGQVVFYQIFADNIAEILRTE
ncbi:hypothetical protein RCL1_005717 [Eukaryota sp. TZLM3-RCL]